MARKLAGIAIPLCGSFLLFLPLVQTSAGVCDGISPTNSTTLTSVVVASGLTGDPLFVVAPPGDRTRIFIVEKTGFIRQLARGAAPTAYTLYLDLTSKITSQGGEQGLLGLAFDPEFASNNLIYVYYTRAGDGDEVVARYRVIPGQTNAQHLASESIILVINDTQATHNGGMIAFGSDDYLYIATGDGGGAGDPHGNCGNAQNTPSLLGKMLRIDVLGISGGTAPECYTGGQYLIPLDNPLRSVLGACDEIWAYGFRNPWRWSFDPANDDLYIGDVGQSLWEEVNWVPGSSNGGENYGWRVMEANHCYTSATECTPPAPACNDASFTDPVVEYGHTGGACSVTGGFVYRGCRMTNFDGTYFYGDYCNGLVRSFKIAGGLATNQQSWPALDFDFGLTSFGVDAEGEHYMTDVSSGSAADRVLKIVPPLSTLEVSGAGADPLLLSRNGNWTWEDVHHTSWHPISSYRIWRADLPNGLFECIYTTASPTWPAGGDPELPAPNTGLYYILTAENSSGEQTLPGGNPPHNLSTAPCSSFRVRGTLGLPRSRSGGRQGRSSARP